MSTVGVNRLPITETVEALDEAAVVDAIMQAFEQEMAIYPIGGGTSLDYGLPPKVEGWGLTLNQMNGVVDYPARDMTITVDAGLAMQQLAATLAEQGQQFPVDVPRSAEATVGGVVATGFNGPRRYGLGSVRDFVIGIRGVDGRGRAFKAGGRVVKNVAGYDFCKLLTGSLGTLAVITQVTLKVRPLPVASAAVAVGVPLQKAEGFLASLASSETTPVAIELLTGEAWQALPPLAQTFPNPPDNTESSALRSPALLVVLFEGTDAEVQWQTERIQQEWQALTSARISVQAEPHAVMALRDALSEFPAGEAPLVLQASLVPSGVVPYMEACLQVDPGCSLQAHAGNGIVIARFSEYPADGLSRMLLGQLAPAAAAAEGNVVVLSNPSGAEMTHQSVWGGIDAPFRLMTRIKHEFDPKNLLNPGRFVYI